MYAKAMGGPLKPLRLYRIAAKSQALFGGLVCGGLLGPRGLFATPRQDRRLRELVILRTCALLGADYEWNVHAAMFASGVGLSVDDLEHTRLIDRNPDHWTSDENCLLGLVETLIGRKGIDDALWHTLSSNFDETALIEYVAVIGLYAAVCYIIDLANIVSEPLIETNPR